MKKNAKTSRKEKTSPQKIHQHFLRREEIKKRLDLKDSENPPPQSSVSL